MGWPFDLLLELLMRACAAAAMLFLVLRAAVTRLFEGLVTGVGEALGKLADEIGTVVLLAGGALLLLVAMVVMVVVGCRTAAKSPLPEQAEGPVQA